MGDVHFYDLPVYRLSSEKFYKDRDKQIADGLYPADRWDSDRSRAWDEAHPDLFREKLARLNHMYGYWRFNEVIGHIRLFFCGDQVRAMYYAVNRQRMVRTDRKKFVNLTDKLVPEVNVRRPFGHPEILDAVQECINRCRRELPRRYIDTSVFDNIADHMDWPAIMAKAAFGPSAID